MGRQQLQQLITWKEQFLPPAFPHLAGSQFIVVLSPLFKSYPYITVTFLPLPTKQMRELLAQPVS